MGQFEAIIKHVEMKLEFHLRSKNHETAGANGSWRCLDSLLFQKISKIPFYGNIKSHIKGYLLSIDWNLWGSLLSVCAVEDKGGISPFAFLDDGSLLGKCQHPSWTILAVQLSGAKNYTFTFRHVATMYCATSRPF